MRFEDKVGVVTGAGGGIGEAYAKALAAEGAKVVIAELNEEGGARVAKEIGDKALFVRTDVGDPSSTDAMVAAASAEFGGVDFLINNAAIFGNMEPVGFMNADYDYLHKFMGVNFYGALHCARSCVPSMVERGGGSIVNQSSTAAWMAAGPYGLAKAAINSLTACLASELGDMNIRVNAIAPGPTNTSALQAQVPGEYLDPMVQSLAIKRLGTPHDHTGPAMFLLSDDAGWVTGHILSVDGGQIVRI